jgi:hypothetical protein
MTQDSAQAQVAISAIEIQLSTTAKPISAVVLLAPD